MPSYVSYFGPIVIGVLLLLFFAYRARNSDPYKNTIAAWKGPVVIALSLLLVVVPIAIYITRPIWMSEDPIVELREMLTQGFGAVLAVITVVTALVVLVALFWFLKKTREKARSLAESNPEWVWAFCLGLIVLLLLGAVAYWAFQYPQFHLHRPTSYDDVVEQTIVLRQKYNRLLSIFDWTNAGVRLLELAGFGVGTLFLVAGRWFTSNAPENRPDIGGNPPTSPETTAFSEVRRFAPWVGGLLLTGVVLIHGIGLVYGTEARRQAYGQASVIIGCVVEATGGHEGASGESAFLLWSAVHRIQASTQASLNELTLGEAKSARTAPDRQGTCSQCERVEACLTRLTRDVGNSREVVPRGAIDFRQGKRDLSVCE